MNKDDKKYEDGEPCRHPGCLSHISHPCEDCGRIAGKNKPSCSTCGDSGEVPTFSNHEGYTNHTNPCPYCQEQKQPSEEAIRYCYDRVGGMMYSHNFTDGRQKYVIEFDYTSQQSRIDELQEKLKVAEEAIEEMASIARDKRWGIGDYRLILADVIHKCNKALSTIKGEEQP